MCTQWQSAGHAQFSTYLQNRPGSILTPTEAPHVQYQSVNGNPAEGQYYQPHGLPDYRGPQQPIQYSLPPPENAPNAAQPPPGLQIAINEIMPGQPGPPPGYHRQPPPHSAGPPQTSVYGGAYYGPEQVAFGQRRRPVRAAQACDSCRQRKAKCDEGRPVCEHCKTNGLTCSYLDVQPPKKHDKQVGQIYDKLQNISETVIKILERQDGFSSVLDTHRRQLEQLQSPLPLDQQNGAQYAKTETSSRYSVTPVVKQEQRPSSAVQQARPQQLLDALGNEATDADEVNEFALPPKHFTAAQYLMEWPSVKGLLKEIKAPTYVLDAESSRGLLHFYGSGEGEDANDGHEGPASPANTHTSSSEGRDDENSPPSPSGVWGSGHLLARSAGSGLSRDHAGGVGPDGGMTLDVYVVDQYFKEYMANIHILHPFLEATALRDMINLFKRRYSWDFVPLTSQKFSTGKRKRDMHDALNSLDHFSPGMVGQPQRRGPGDPVEVEHSIANAIVLLVMALGNICAHNGPLPACPQAAPAAILTPQSHCSDETMTSASASRSTAQGHKGRFSGVQVAISRSADPPGLAYFAKGAAIIGELPGGSSVSHVQANILAGLYMSQLARILPAHFYFYNASRGCMVLIESIEYKDKAIMRHAKRNLINLAFWSCLQLESDILAEVELPPSGITRYEGPMHQELPSMVTLNPIPESSDMDSALRFYSYQIALQKELNRIHKTLYVDRSLDGFDNPSKLYAVLDGNLEQWRSQLGSFNWDDDHHKSQDINVARMRAKYYGAKYIIHRPTLAYALYHLLEITSRNRPSESPMGAPSSQQPSPAMTQPAADSRYARANVENRPVLRVQHLEPWIKESAKACVEAAIRSTTSFDAVKERLIITNIFGTAHAQFGNVLVLAATFRSDLGYLVDGQTLKDLLHRTIKFLEFSKNISPTLFQDADILKQVREVLFGDPEYEPQSISTTSSLDDGDQVYRW